MVKQVHHQEKNSKWRPGAPSCRPWNGKTSLPLDLSEAYLHVPISPAHRRCLHFSYGIRHYQYRALPFGLLAAPRVFTKILVALIANLRRQGISLFPYLDDIVIAGSSSSRVAVDLGTTMTFLRQHGFVINLTKSSLVPTQGLIHLGLLVDTRAFQLYLSPEHRGKLKQSLHIRDVHSTSLMTLASFPGLYGLVPGCDSVILVPPETLASFPLPLCSPHRAQDLPACDTAP